jgi:hypothetical protein
VVRLVPVRRKARKLGQWKGKVTMADDFDAPRAESFLWLHQPTCGLWSAIRVGDLPTAVRSCVS